MGRFGESAPMSRWLRSGTVVAAVMAAGCGPGTSSAVTSWIQRVLTDSPSVEAPATADPDDNERPSRAQPDKARLAAEVIAHSGYAQRYERAIPRRVEAAIKVQPSLSNAAAERFFRRRASFAVVEGAAAEMYGQRFSAEELQAIDAFVSTSAAQALSLAGEEASIELESLSERLMKREMSR